MDHELDADYDTIVCTLSKLSSNNNGLRTNVIEGIAGREPTVGYSFATMSDPLTSGALGRLVTTSKVVSVERLADGSVVFNTLNSQYLYEPHTKQTSN